jgi:hypothetical protein
VRVEEWAGLVTDASPFAIPPGGASELVNLRPQVGRLSSRRGMRRVVAAGGGPTQTLVDLSAVEVGGKPVLIALTASGDLIALQTPAYGREVRSAVPGLCPAQGEVLIDYDQEIATTIPAYESDTCLEGDTLPPGTVGFEIDGGYSSTDCYPYSVDGNESCDTLGEVDGGNAAYNGATLLTEDDLCSSAEPCAGVGDLPSVPLNLASTFGPARADLTWDPPASDGGSPILEYIVQVDVGGIFGSVPGKPGPVTVTFGNASASLSWAAPADDGGFPITTYVVRIEELDGFGSWNVIPTVVPSAPALDGGGLDNQGDTVLNLFAPLPGEYVKYYEWLLDGAPVQPTTTSPISTISGTTFTFAGDQTSPKVFLVRAVNAAGAGPYSAPITVF